MIASHVDQTPSGIMKVAHIPIHATNTQSKALMKFTYVIAAKKITMQNTMNAKPAP